MYLTFFSLLFADFKIPPPDKSIECKAVYSVKNPDEDKDGNFRPYPATHWIDCRSVSGFIKNGNKEVKRINFLVKMKSGEEVKFFMDDPDGRSGYDAKVISGGIEAAWKAVNEAHPKLNLTSMEAFKKEMKDIFPLSFYVDLNAKLYEFPDGPEREGSPMTEEVKAGLNSNYQDPNKKCDYAEEPTLITIEKQALSICTAKVDCDGIEAEVFCYADVTTEGGFLGIMSKKTAKCPTADKCAEDKNVKGGPAYSGREAEDIPKNVPIKKVNASGGSTR